MTTSDPNNKVKIWDLYGSQISGFGEQDNPNSANFSPNRKYIVTTSDSNNIVKIWDLSGKRIQDIVNLNPVNSASFSPDGKRIVTISSDGSARVWLVQPLLPLPGYPGSFSPDGKKILTIALDKTAKIWDLSGQEIATLQANKDIVNSASFSPDGKYILTTFLSPIAKVWDSSGKEIATLKGHLGIVNSARFSPDSQYIVTTSVDQTAKIWDLSGREIASLKGHKGVVNSASFSPNKNEKLIVVTAADDKTAKIWDLSGREIASLKGHKGIVNSASFNPNGKQIVTASNDKTAKVWDTSGKEIATLKGHLGIVNSASFSPNGEQIVTSSIDNTAKLWSLSGQPIATLKGHLGIVNSASFSPDGKRILTTSLDETARIWSLSGRELAAWSDVSKASFSPDRDGQNILTTSSNNYTYIRSVKNLNQLVKQSCEWLQGYIPYKADISETLKLPTWQQVGQICNFASTVALSPSSVRLQKKVIVVVDPGHGLPPDTGSQEIVSEDDVALSISKKIADILQQNGVQVVLTRDTYNNVVVNTVIQSLSYRAKKAKQVGASLFISIHANAFNGNQNGIETYYDDKSDHLAQVVHSSIIQNISGLRDRGLQLGNHLYILKNNSVPAILIETGFIDYPKDALRLNDIDYHNQMADAIASGILKYLQQNDVAK